MTKRILTITVLAHVVAIGGLVLASVIKRKVKVEPTHEVVSWVQMQPVLEEPITPMPAVKEPVIEPEPPAPKLEEPKPPMIEEAAPEIPLKPKKKLKKANEIQVSKKKIKRQQNVNPKPRPTPRPRVRPPTAEEIRKTLATQVPVQRQVQRTSTSAGEPDMTFFYAMVKEKMYGAWQQPRGLASHFSAVVKIRVTRSGAITQRTLIRPSGHTVMDKSVMKAANSVSHIIALPAGFTGSYKDVTVEFEIENAR